MVCATTRAASDRSPSLRRRESVGFRRSAAADQSPTPRSASPTRNDARPRDRSRAIRTDARRETFRSRRAAHRAAGRRTPAADAWIRPAPQAARRDRCAAPISHARAAPGPSRQDAELIERDVQLLGIAVHAKRARARQLVFAVAAAQESDAEHLRAPRSEQIPDGVANDVAVVWRHAEPLLAVQEEIGRGLRALDVAPFDDHRLAADAKAVERAIDLGTPPRRRDAVLHAGVTERAQQLARARERAALGKNFLKELSMPLLQRVGLGL